MYNCPLTATERFGAIPLLHTSKKLWEDGNMASSIHSQPQGLKQQSGVPAAIPQRALLQAAHLEREPTTEGKNKGRCDSWPRKTR